MSLTPGWQPKKFMDFCPGEPVTITWSYDEAHYYLDNGQEFKDFPRTKEGWEALCETLKGFEV